MGRTDLGRVICRIAGLTVECFFREEIMLSRCEKYRCTSDRTDMTVRTSPADEVAAARSWAHLSAAERELMLTGRDFYTKLIDYEGFMLHSSAVEVDGRAYLFSAPSGTGKSTHTEQWLKLFGDRARIINDDKPAIRFMDGRVFACGTPWSGKNDISENVCVPLQGICLLERSEENFIRRISADEAAFGILNQTIREMDDEHVAVLLDLIDRAIDAVPVWRLGCNISEAAAVMAYRAMSQADI